MNLNTNENANMNVNIKNNVNVNVSTNVNANVLKLRIIVAKGAIFCPPFQHTLTTKRSTTNPAPFELSFFTSNFLLVSVSGRNYIRKTAFNLRENTKRVLLKLLIWAIILIGVKLNVENFAPRIA